MGVGSGKGIWFLNAVYFLELSFYSQKSAETNKILSIPVKNLTSCNINNAKTHWNNSCRSQNMLKSLNQPSDHEIWHKVSLV